MQMPPRVVICGQSIFALAMEAALVSKSGPGPEIVRVHPHLPAIIERIAALQPAVVLLESCGDHAALALALLRRAIPLVALYLDTGQGVLMTGQPVTFAHRPDLDRLIDTLQTATTAPVLGTIIQPGYAALEENRR
jgi:hypothetical protein